MSRYLLFLILVLLHSVPCTSAVRAEVVSSMDIVMVLDNSGSMKTNDPGHLTKSVVSDFLNRLPGDVRVGLVIFDGRARLAIPLTPTEQKGTSQKIMQKLNELDYSGKYTDLPSAIERAIYELKQNGRKNVEKLIIFMTDGIIDTGDQARDIDKRDWLKDELSLESKNEGIRIFGIAFTENADFGLIQVLGLKTGGGYYRALRAEDIQGVLGRIKETISKPEAKLGSDPESKPTVAPNMEQQRSFPMSIVGLSAIVLLAIVLVILRSRSSGDLQESIPPACLIDIDGVTYRENYRIEKSVVTIGRAEHGSIDINIDESTISAVHAQIEYRDHNFYFTDLQSTNGSYLNGRMETDRITDEIRLKNGDVIFLGKNRFRFIANNQHELCKAKLKQLSGETVLAIPDNPQPEPKAAEQNVPSLANLREEAVQEVEDDKLENIMEESSSGPLDYIEREHIEEVLRITRGNKTKASKMMGISKQTLYSRMKELNIPSQN